MSSPDIADGVVASPPHDELQQREDPPDIHPPDIHVLQHVKPDAAGGFGGGLGTGGGPAGAKLQPDGEVGGDGAANNGGADNSGGKAGGGDSVRGVSTAGLVAFDGVLVALITGAIKDNQLWFALGVIVFMFVMHVYLKSGRRQVRKAKRASLPAPLWRRWGWLPCLLAVAAGGIVYLRPDWVAHWLPGAPFPRVEQAAAKNQAKSYLAGVSEFLTWEPGVKPSSEQFDYIKEKFDLLTDERALGNLRSTNALTEAQIGSLGFDQAWEKLLADNSKYDFFRTFRQGYGAAEELTVLGMFVEPIPEQSDEYESGVRYAVFATLAYEGKYVLEDERIKKLSTAALILAISLPTTAEHQLIADFLKRSFADVTDAMVEEIGNNLIERPAGELRNDDRWEKAYLRVKPDGRILPEAMVKAREEIMVRYPMSLDETKASGVKGFTRNLWRMGSSSQRVVTRTGLP